MKNFKKIIQIILVSTSILILSGCFPTDLSKDLSNNFSKDDMKRPIQEYLRENFGLTGDIHIISATNFALAGTDHEVYFEIYKPYHAFVNLFVSRDTLKVLPAEKREVYLALFKAAYIKQHPEIIQFSNELIRKYNLVGPIQYVKKDIGEENKVNVEDLYYLEMNFGGNTQISKLVNSFKKKQSIDTSQTLPTIIKHEPEEYIGRIGIVNFIYEYVITDNTKKAPQSKELVDEFKKSKLLKKGLYNVEIQAIDKEEFHDDEHSSFTLFRVDDKGNYTIIPVVPEPAH